MLSVNGRSDNVITNPLRKLANDLADTEHKNNINNIFINNQDTNIPNNLPTAIIGDKGSGKSTMIKAIMEGSMKEGIFNHIYFIYSSLSWDEELPTYITKIDINNCDEFLANLFEIKTIFNSYLKLFEAMSNKQWDDNEIDLDNFLAECDNNVIKYNQDVVNSGMDAHVVIDKIINTGDKIIQKFSKDFYIGNVKVEGLKKDERDAIIIDDIAIAAKVLFRQIKDNPLYEYLTLTRHMRLFVLFAGQQIEQIPKTIRREIMCWLISKNSNIELLQGVLSKRTLTEIENKQTMLQKYEFVLFNCVDGYLGII